MIQAPKPGMHVQVINLKNIQGMLMNRLHLEERTGRRVYSREFNRLHSRSIQESN